MKNTFPIYLLILPIFLFNILFTQDKKVKKQNKTSIIAKTNERNNFENNNSDEYLELFNQVYSKLEKSYVDSINSSDVILSGIKGMMSPLDPYTKILMGKSKESYEMLARGKYGGVGMRISEVRDTIIITQVFEDIAVNQQLDIIEKGTPNLN